MEKKTIKQIANENYNILIYKRKDIIPQLLKYDLVLGKSSTILFKADLLNIPVIKYDDRVEGRRTVIDKL